jgi:hypothetical protein
MNDYGRLAERRLKGDFQGYSYCGGLIWAGLSSFLGCKIKSAPLRPRKTRLLVNSALSAAARMAAGPDSSTDACIASQGVEPA